MRRVHIVVPERFLDEVMAVVQSNKYTFCVQKFLADDGVHISFRIQPKHLQGIMVYLTKMGCGEAFGTIDVYDTILSRPAAPAKAKVDGTSARLYSISDRMTIDEIEVRSLHFFTCNFVFVIVSLICGIN